VETLFARATAAFSQEIATINRSGSSTDPEHKSVPTRGAATSGGFVSRIQIFTITAALLLGAVLLAGCGSPSSSASSSQSPAPSPQSAAAAESISLVGPGGSPFSSGETLSGGVIFTISATASNTSHIQSLELDLIDGSGGTNPVWPHPGFQISSTCNASLSACNTKETSFDSKSLPNGSYTLVATVIDSDGGQVSTTGVPVTVANQNTPPGIAVSSPTNNQTLSGATTISFSVTDVAALQSATLAVDGTHALQTVSSFGQGSPVPATFVLNTMAYADGPHTLTITVLDQDLNTAQETLTVQFQNHQSGNVTGAVLTQGSPAFQSLEIDGSTGADSIYVSQAGNTINISANGKPLSFTGPFQSVIVRGWGGADAITVDSTVTIESLVYCNGGCTVSSEGTNRNTVMTVSSTSSVSSGTANQITGNASTSAWVTTSDSVTGVSGAKLHVVQDLVRPPEPSDMANGARDYSWETMWASGPTLQDAFQGNIGDCYLLAALQGIAGESMPNLGAGTPSLPTTVGSPNVLREILADMGDGHALVKFASKSPGGTPVYVQVTKLFAFQGALPSPVTGSVWVRTMEKAFAYYRTGANTFKSLGGGSQIDLFAAIGASYAAQDSIPSFFNNLPTFETLVDAQLSGGQAVGLITAQTTTDNIYAGHDYSLLWVRTDASGNRIYTITNPFPQSGYATVNGVFDISEAVFKANFVHFDGWTTNLPSLY